jgi:hypothetical protein
MHTCTVCNYTTNTLHNLKIHNNSKKHLNIINAINNKLICPNCNKQYTHKSSLSRHKSLCKSSSNKLLYEYEIERIKKDYEHKLEIERLKSELNKKDFEKIIETNNLERKLEIKELENKHLLIQSKNQINNVVNTTNNTINVVKISKVEYLNLNFSNVIDIHTFIDNYRNKYGLNNDQTKTLLENYQTDGVNGCINALVYYLKKSAIQQYKELKGEELGLENVILPFILSDKSLREHFEKSINGSWDKTTMIDNLKKIVTITNDQIYKHHNQFMGFNGPQRKRIINGLLKASAFSILTDITIPNFYKIGNSQQTQQSITTE